jgi:hypothetical protein
LQIIHQACETGLWLLAEHCAPLDVLDFCRGFGALSGRFEAADVMEDVSGCIDSQRFSKFYTLETI